MSPLRPGPVGTAVPGPAGRGGRRRALAGAVAGLLALSGCAGLRTLVAPPPESAPGQTPGWLAYRVGALRLEAPGEWAASGDARRVTLEADGLKLEAWVVEGRFDDARACLAAGEEALQRGAERLNRVRRHATTLAGRAAVMQEADAGGWHGWAYAVCDGPVQHRLFFTGRSPIPAAVLESWRGVVKGVRLGGGS